MKPAIHRDIGELHNAFLMRLHFLMQDIHQAGLPFDIFEAYRTPERQKYLYSKGRFGPLRTRRIVTKAKRWHAPVRTRRRYRAQGPRVDLASRPRVARAPRARAPPRPRLAVLGSTTRPVPNLDARPAKRNQPTEEYDGKP